MPEELHKINPIPLDILEEIQANELTPTPSQPTHKKPWLFPILYKIQKYSAYSFVSFVGIHLTSVVIVPILPIDTGIKQEVFSLAKAVYHALPLYETTIIYGSSLLHVISGVTLRVLRTYERQQKKKNKKTGHFNMNDSIQIKDSDDDIGLGGISSIFGLGYKKSWISQTFGVSPLQFSGYILIPLVAYHYFKFRLSPLLVEGDSSLINLDYITYMVNLRNPTANLLALSGLVWTATYHVCNGLLKLNHKFNKNWKRFGLVMINAIGSLGMLAIYYYKIDTDIINVNGYLGKSFASYINSFWI
ncbi:uncharacterized protein SPAPADRAFT_63639 [Spathaspora passalidarum NRRL Y-27907]|uniref:Mitochondrial adapter protein MCP1 transmembrane domain-containing protein n=1 Tax=Spathaspora passalidarum (strain NRRL Y-27907 / 11-Y1) TaxID=619300 RepID=G3AVX6_SPAPN|nr:uncharacterized protein SPAPADRAFT_63639 [Spathaspora passalidarum NRRL Y-27907]EGW30021.1 hypothetical protein SPAPADRAFT_63639 [Spathaspora passalidarum NRRL Y-27907]